MQVLLFQGLDMNRLRATTLLLCSLVLTPAFASDAWRAYVQTQPLAELGIELKQSFAAEVISLNHTELASELNARVLSVTTRPGDQVQQGQLLVKLDCQDIQLQRKRILAQQKQTQANLALAKLQVKRFEDLATRELTSASQLDEANNQVVQQQAALDMLAVDLAIAQRQIERCHISAPFEGAVVEQKIGEGQWVNIGQPLLALVQTSQAEIETQVPLSWLNQQSQSWQVEFKTNSEVYKDLKLLRQAASIDPRTRSVKLWFAAPKSLAIGRSGELTLIRPGRYIPANLIVKRDGRYGVYAVENGRLQFKHLDQAEEGRPYPIPGSWPQNLELVTAGQNRLNLNDLN